MADMVKLFVNGQEVEVESGKNLIDALALVGIEIPHFCYHPALGADGNCRMCLVGIENGRPPLVPACKTPVQEGINVLLDAEHIKKIQRDVLEFEFINHPVDCPICDQAGECDLQDYYMKYSREDSRMRVDQVAKGKKMDFGCGVVHDQERCVLCGRCVRFTRQITGTGELGIVNRSDAARVDIFPGRPLDNRYALNVVDLCPVGAMTSRDFRFRQRAWFLTRDEGVCHGCSRGCNIYIDHHREKYKDDIIYRFRARKNLQVNGYFMCDEGRLGYHLENDNRQTLATIDGSAVDFAAGIQAVVERLDRAKKPLMLVSPDCSVEQMWAVRRIATLYGAQLSGYSDHYIKKGDGDDYLIRDDKAANRKGLELLEIDQDQDHFLEWLNDADLFINFNNDLLRNTIDDKLKTLLASTDRIAVCSHDYEVFRNSAVILPTASYSEYGGTVISEQGILQKFEKAVFKNEEPKDILEITRLLGGAITDASRAWRGIRQSIEALAGVDLEHIPAEGLNLAASEAENVSA